MGDSRELLPFLTFVRGKCTRAHAQVAISEKAGKPVKVLSVSFSAGASRATLSERGVRALSRALGVSLPSRVALYFLLSCTTLYDNEHDIDEFILSQLDELHGDDQEPVQPEGPAPTCTGDSPCAV